MAQLITNSDYLEKIDPILKELVILELQNGNKIVECWKGWPKSGIVIKLKKDIKLKNINKFCLLKIKLVNDPHMWAKEIFCESSIDMVVIEFNGFI